MAASDDSDWPSDPEEEEEYIHYDIATYPSDLTLSGID
jgi:hypothetical protein